MFRNRKGLAAVTRRVPINVTWLAQITCVTAGALQAQPPPTSAVAPGGCDTTEAHQIYEHRCASCHGLTLGGGKAPALTGTGFWEHWQGQPVRKLHAKIRMTMPSDRPGSLRSDEVTRLVAYLLERNGHADLCAAVGSEQGLDTIITE